MWSGVRGDPKEGGTGVSLLTAIAAHNNPGTARDVCLHDQ
jgi:hypothetical protein